MSAYLVVNADDFGLTEGNNRAIADAHRLGIVTSASLLANGGAFDHAVELARKTPGLGVGVHLTLTEGPPIVSSSVLAPNGSFPLSNQPFVRAWLTGRLPCEPIRQEFEAQIRKVMSEGISPTHLDGHKYIHLLPGIVAIVLSLAHKFAIPFVRVPHRPADSWQSHPMRLPGLAILTTLGQLTYPQARKAGVQMIDRYAGFVDTGHLTVRALHNLLERPCPGITELVCHPAYRTDEHERLFAGGYHWIAGYDFATETAAVSLPELRDILRDSGWTLRHFGEF